ncbi:hypothetical protein VE03_06645 [Pseudogymnoascus sp. 23342-1-I1]|nr:hypothetical protein VE03_06645 [Pseudogymnoascus sp. 23342-1-I1]
MGSCAQSKDDDTTALDEAISKTNKEDLKHFYKSTRATAIQNSAIAILNNLIRRGVDITPQWPSQPRGASQETLELLLEQGWDINARGDASYDREPFMWAVADDYDLVKWCLEHGASVHPSGQEPFRDGATTKSRRECLQILEIVAAWGSIEALELLRSKGAPAGWRSLHLAVETATFGYSEKDKDFVFYSERMAMVRHLLDVFGLDVNAPDQPLGIEVLPRQRGTPTCYIPDSTMLVRDTRELTWLLLDRGADPTPALEIARGEYRIFAEDVEAWKGKQARDCKCSVQ